MTELDVHSDATATVGRRWELARLTEIVAGVANGAARGVEIFGDPGIGKTHLLSALARMAKQQGIPVITGRPVHRPRDTPFGMIGDALTEPLARLGQAQRRELLELGDGVLGAICLALSDTPAPFVPPSDQRPALWHAVHVAIERLAGTTGLVVLFDDIHRADPLTAEILGYLVRHPPRSVVLAIAYRPRQLPVALATVLQTAADVGELVSLELGPLDRSAADDLIGSTAGAGRRALLYRQAEGNPCYLQALAHGGQPAAGTEPTGEDVAPAMPRQLQTALRAEIDALAPVPRLVAEAAAVVGDQASPALIGQVAELAEPDVLAALDELVHHDVLRVGKRWSTFAFRHDVLRQFVYRSARAGWKIGAHARAAAALGSAEAPAVVLAPHVARSSRFGDLASVTVLAKAAQDVRGNSLPLAARWYGTALRLLPDAPRHRPLRGKLLAGLAQVIADGRQPPETPRIDPVVVPQQDSPTASLDRLSRREHEVAELIARGDTNRQIARSLNVTEHTVEVHVGRILRKLDVRSRTAVARIVTLSEGTAPQPLATAVHI